MIALWALFSCHNPRFRGLKVKTKNIFFIDFASSISFTCDFIFVLIYFPAAGFSKLSKYKEYHN